MEGKKHSSDFVRAKKLMYIEKYDVNQVTIEMEQSPSGDQKHSATITFNKDGHIEKIQSCEFDFVFFAWSLKTSIHDGLNKIIEVKNMNKYYENIDFFVANQKRDLETAKSDLLTGKQKLSDDFSSELALEDIIKKKYKTSQVNDVMKKYVYVLANEFIIIGFLKKQFEKLKRKSNDPTKFVKMFNLAGKIYQDHLFSLPPLKAVEIYGKRSRINLEHITKSLLHQHTTSHEKWEGLTQNATKKIEGKSGAKHMLDEYCDYYELTYKMLRHLAFIASNSNSSSFKDSQKGIEDILEQAGYGQLLEPIIKSLRNAGSHWEADYSEKGKIILIDSRSGKSKKIGEITYEELIHHTNLIKELSKALLISILMTERLLYLKALDSPDLKIILVENFEH